MCLLMHVCKAPLGREQNSEEQLVNQAFFFLGGVRAVGGSLVSNSASTLGPGDVKRPVPGEPYYDPDLQSISTTLKRIHNTMAIKARRVFN